MACDKDHSQTDFTIKDLPINQLDFNLLAEHKETQWKNYRDIVFAYESQ